MKTVGAVEDHDYDWVNLSLNFEYCKIIIIRNNQKDILMSLSLLNVQNLYWIVYSPFKFQLVLLGFLIKYSDFWI